MIKVINFNEYKSRRNRVEDTEHARKYMFSIDIDSLEVEITESLYTDVKKLGRVEVRLNFSKIAREQDTTVYKVKKAYKNLLDNKVLIEISKEPGRPVLVSTKNLIIALRIPEGKELLSMKSI